MKNYKFIVPIALIAFFAVSVFYLANMKQTEENTYNAYLEAAREYRELDIQVDAESNYKAALSAKPSLELYMEIAEFYQETEQNKKAISWGESIISAYPKEKDGYEYLMQIYYDNSDYIACFDLYDTVEKRELQSELVETLISDIRYTYYFTAEYLDVGIFSEGLCAVSLGEQWGYVNESGIKKISYSYSEAGCFSNSLASVVDTDGNAYFIDTDGNKKWVVSGVDKIVRLGMIVSDIFPLYDGTEWSFYNKENELITEGYEEVSSLGNGIAAVMKDDAWTLIDTEGKTLTDQTYDGVAMDEKTVVYRNDRLFVYQDGAYYMIDSEGKTIGSGSYEDVHIFNDTTYAAVEINGKWGFVDKDGNVVIEAQYEDARSFANGFAAVEQDGKWGFINTDGELVIETQFDDAKDFTSSGTVFVRDGEVWTLLCLYLYNH